MKPHGHNPSLCSLDPVTLTALAVGAGAGGLASLFGGSKPGSPQAPPTPAEAAPPVQQPTGSQKSGAPQSTLSFVGSAAVPSQVGYGSKTLLGQ